MPVQLRRLDQRYDGSRTLTAAQLTGEQLIAAA